jgi:mannose-6-phosphate isomerase
MNNSSVSAEKLPSNQFDHFYRGGNRIGKLRKGPGGPMRPEEWIASTTTRFGEKVNGLSVLANGKLLRDEVMNDPQHWLGSDHVKKYGSSTEILVKLLDPDQRLPVHYHPDRKFASDKLDLAHGKTEAWIILDAPIGAKVGVGFNRKMSKSEVAELVSKHDSQGLLDSLMFLEVSAGDVVFVPAGVPHAIEAGIFVLELQEPTDLSILLEWDGFAVDGDKDGHLDLGYEVALDALRLEPLTEQEISQIITRFDKEKNASQRIFNSIADDFFRADYLSGDNAVVDAGFGILLILEGTGKLEFSDSNTLQVEAGDAVVIANAAGSFTLRGATGIISRPPLA